MSWPVAGFSKKLKEIYKREKKLKQVEESFAEQMSDYLNVPDLDEYIVPVANGDNAGILGCFYLAKTLVK